MGKSGRKSKHDRKMERKREVKRARREKYAALAGTSKRAKRQHKHGGPTGDKHQHRMNNCGNPGCKKCRGVGIPTPKAA